MRRSLFARKPISLLLEEMNGEHRLRRVLGPVSLTSLGVGAVIGTGIFVLTGIAAHDKTGPALIVSFLVAGITSVLLVLMLSQPRVWLARARDGLVPRHFFGAVHPRFRTPWKATILTGIFVAGMAGLVPLRILAELVNIGTLLASVIVCAAVLVMRRTEPDAERHFRAPLVPAVPILGIVFCLVLMFSLPAENWLRLVVWLLIGFGVYFGYGRHHSVMSQRLADQATAPPARAADS